MQTWVLWASAPVIGAEESLACRFPTGWSRHGQDHPGAASDEVRDALKDEERVEEIVAAQEKSFHHVTHDLFGRSRPPNSTVRKQAMHSLQVLPKGPTGKSVTVIMEPHKAVRPRPPGGTSADSFFLQV